ncbi:LOW QUALITY PROTEIN: hypothetical protein IFM46972_06269 [Aspergillus udagawae]|uniref:Uncharacterized protein n=1 Tax=Aspergillus udagawae TaxID=91492 RepID=A0A8H3NXI6_9EURO|nr:LOW QUALITY PROTEIN: hypothetical protein IFM46972_06269 [Aspergillus udagawae]
MESIVEATEERDRGKRKAIVFAFLSAVFFFVPVVAREWAEIACHNWAQCRADGNGRYRAVGYLHGGHDKKNAPLAIFNLIRAPLALLDIARVTREAIFRRAMPGEGLAKLSDKLAARTVIISRIKDRCPI